MSWTKPSSAIDQIDEREGLSEANAKTKTFSFKAPYSDLQTAKNALAQGDVISSGWEAKSWTLTRIPGNWGRLEIECVENNTDSTSGEKSPLKVTWSIKSVRNDVSLYAYIDGEDFPFGRYLIEMWLKETNQELAENYSFKDESGKTYRLSDYTIQPLAEKFASGIESVMRFYPILTKRTITSNPPAAVLSNLAHVDVPTVTTNAKVVKAPGNLNTIISNYEWVKCQDDLDEQQDGNFVRIESWMGILKTEGSWDANLYGNTNERWEMKHFTT